MPGERRLLYAVVIEYIELVGHIGFFIQFISHMTGGLKGKVFSFQGYIYIASGFVIAFCPAAENECLFYLRIFFQNTANGQQIPLLQPKISLHIIF